MEYKFLIGHRIKCSYFQTIKNRNIKFTGYVPNVVIDNKYNLEKIFIINDNGYIEWFYPFHKNIEDLKIKILDWNKSEKDNRKVSRFEIMDI